MKSNEIYEVLWRSSIRQQCGYALMLGMFMMGSIQVTWIEPNQVRLNALMRDQASLHGAQMSAEAVEAPVVMRAEKACAWEKTKEGWYMTSDFNTVYHCVMHEENAPAIASVRLNKSIMGVSVVLGFDEMPA